MTTVASGQSSHSENGEAHPSEVGATRSSTEEVELEDGGVLLRRRRRTRDGAATRESARIITMVWGDRYVDDLLNLTIPAILAPDNLPAFVGEFRTELVVVTEMRLFERFRLAPVIGKVLDQCDVRLLPIDDLLSPWYGITLTYALVRGFADLGAAMVDTHLVFINADFILANGSYRKLAEVIKRGERLVVSPSYCMNLEDTLRPLRAARDKNSNAISVAPRDMAALLIANRHNTVRAKTVNQRLFRIHRYDQFYWYVDDRTMLARQMPIAVVYMRPERALTEMPTFWDYGVISEYCPNIKPCVLGDSDDFLMAELRTSNTFGELLHLGWPTLDEIAADLSSFTTQDHRDYGRHTLVLHSGDLPSNIKTDRQEFDRFVDQVYQRLDPPVSYRNHRFWAAGYPQFIARQTTLAREMKGRSRLRREVTGADHASRRSHIQSLRVTAAALEVESEKLEDEASADAASLARLGAERRELDDESSKAELNRAKRRIAILSQIVNIYGQLELANAEEVGESRAPESTSPQMRPAFSRILQSFNRLYDLIFGRMPKVTTLNPLHAVIRQVVLILSQANEGKASSYLFLSSGGVLGTGLKRVLTGAGLTLTPVMARLDLYRGIQSGQFDVCFCDLSFEELFSFRETFEKVRPYMRSGGKFVCFFYNASSIDLDNWTGRLTQSLFPLKGKSKIWFTGSRVAALNMRLHAWMYSRINYGVLGLLRTGCLLFVGAALALISELIEHRRDPHVLPKHCTSMTIEIEL